MRVSLRRFRTDDGAVLVIVALCIGVIFGATVLAIDVGGLLNARRRMVGAVDAGALAAAQSCAESESADVAQAQSDAFAKSNVSTVEPVSFDAEECGLSSSGEVKVAYEMPQHLVFAPILGQEDEAMVEAKATAIWGPAQAGPPPPLEFSQDSLDCIHDDIGSECTYWLDQDSNDFDANSNWGMLDLREDVGWGVEPDAECDAPEKSDVKDWMSGDAPVDVTLNEIPTYSCAVPGHGTSSWNQLGMGEIRYFPVTDPDAAILSPPNSEKFAVVGFVPLQTEELIRGDDPRAIGIPGTPDIPPQSGDCESGNMTMSSGSVLAYAAFAGNGCPNGTQPDSASDPRVYRMVRGNPIPQVRCAPGQTVGCDYSYDPTTFTVLWVGPEKDKVRMDFSWSKAGIEGTPDTPGKCPAEDGGARDPDPNAYCLVVSWQGPQEGGSEPCQGDDCADFGLRAIRLSE